MTDRLLPPSPDRIETAGRIVLRYSLVLIFGLFGLMKFTHGEATSIQPLMAHSPFFSWLYALTDVQGASNVIGVVEVAAAAAIASRLVLPLASAVGSLAAACALVLTLSFLVTTPKLREFQGFLIKDLTLLGAALYTAGEALGAARERRWAGGRPAAQTA